MIQDFQSAPFREIHYRLTLGAALGYISDGLGLGVVGLAITAAHAQLALTPYWEGMLGAASLVGLFVGAIVSGSLVDRFGRRPLYSYNMIAFVAVSALQLGIHSREALLLSRLALGAVLGSDYVVTKTLLIEFIPHRYRGRILGSMSVFWAGGYALGYLVGLVLADSGPNSWRWILASSALPALATIPLRLNTPESPLWLELRGRSAQAQLVIEKLIGKGYGLLSSPTVPQRQPASNLNSSFTYRKATFVAVTIYACLVVPYFAVSTFIPVVMSALHVEGTGGAGSIYIMCLLAGSMLGFTVVDRLPRRHFAIGSFCITSLALFVAILSPKQAPLMAVAGFGIFSCVLSAAQAQVFVYLPELFPTAVRGQGLGIAVAASRVAAAIGTFLMPVCVEHWGVRPALYACVGALVIGGVTSYLWAPETRVETPQAFSTPAKRIQY